MLGAIIPAAATLIGADMRNRQQTQAAATQQAFQERMSSTSYQRAMQDMREAGLNPMLAAKVGGASSPVGAMPNLTNVLGDAAAAYTSAYQAETGRRQQEQQADKIAVEKDKMQEEMSNLRTERARIGWLVSKTFYEADNARKTGRLIGFEANRAEELWKIAVEDLKLIKGDVEAMQELRNIGRLSKELKPIADFFLNLIGGAGAGYLIKKGFSKRAPQVMRGVLRTPAVTGRP